MWLIRVQPRNVFTCGGVMTDTGRSPELVKFLQDQDLAACCTVNHLAENYCGNDRPASGKGRLARYLQWLARIRDVELYKHEQYGDCARLRTALAPSAEIIPGGMVQQALGSERAAANDPPRLVALRDNNDQEGGRGGGG